MPSWSGSIRPSWPPPPRWKASQEILELALSDFSLIEGFGGFYSRGGSYEAEPFHRVTILAKWRHLARSEKIYHSGYEIDLEETHFFISAASNKDATDASCAYHNGLQVYLIEDVFSALVDAVARGDVKEARTWLRTELEITSHRRESPADPVHVPIPKELKRLLYVIIGLLVAVLVQLWLR
jgi:hypothetical protein